MMFNTFNLNKDLFKNYENLLGKYSAKALLIYEDIIKFSNSEIFEQSDIILIAF